MIPKSVLRFDFYLQCLLIFVAIVCALLYHEKGAFFFITLIFAAVFGAAQLLSGLLIGLIYKSKTRLIYLALASIYLAYIFFPKRGLDNVFSVLPLSLLFAMCYWVLTLSDFTTATNSIHQKTEDKEILDDLNQNQPQ
jgi:hypothetical protein